jgi:hypothetical protein
MKNNIITSDLLPDRSYCIVKLDGPHYNRIAFKWKGNLILLDNKSTEPGDFWSNCQEAKIPVLPIKKNRKEIRIRSDYFNPQIRPF